MTHYRHGVTYTLVGAITAAGMPGLEHDQTAWCATGLQSPTHLRLIISSPLSSAQGHGEGEAAACRRGGQRPGMRGAVQSNLSNLSATS